VRSRSVPPSGGARSASSRPTVRRPGCRTAPPGSRGAEALGIPLGDGLLERGLPVAEFTCTGVRPDRVRTNPMIAFDLIFNAPPYPSDPDDNLMTRSALLLAMAKEFVRGMERSVDVGRAPGRPSFGSLVPVLDGAPWGEVDSSSTENGAEIDKGCAIPTSASAPTTTRRATSRSCCELATGSSGAQSQARSRWSDGCRRRGRGGVPGGGQLVGPSRLRPDTEAPEEERSPEGVALGELRQAVGFHVAQIAVKYGIDVEEPLSSIFPAADDDGSETSEERRPQRSGALSARLATALMRPRAINAAVAPRGRDRRTPADDPEAWSAEVSWGTRGRRSSMRPLSWLARLRRPRW
jgi:hypothetical protein